MALAPLGSMGLMMAGHTSAHDAKRELHQHGGRTARIAHSVAIRVRLVTVGAVGALRPQQ